MTYARKMAEKAEFVALECSDAERLRAVEAVINEVIETCAREADPGCGERCGHCECKGARDAVKRIRALATPGAPPTPAPGMQPGQRCTQGKNDCIEGGSIHTFSEMAARGWAAIGDEIRCPYVAPTSPTETPSPPLAAAFEGAIAVAAARAETGRPVCASWCGKDGDEAPDKAVGWRRGTFCEPMLVQLVTESAALADENARLRDFAQGFADEPCHYGDDCPPFGARHGRCLNCRARAAMEAR